MAKKMMDAALDADGDLKAVDGDLGVEESTITHQKRLVLHNKGDYAAYPTICVGAQEYIDDDDGSRSLMREITRQWGNDGMKVQSVEMNQAGEIVARAEY